METRKQKQNRWAIILAGGEGTRLADVSCRIAGEKTPKQFCRIIDDQSLIEQTRQRVELAIPKDRIFYTLNRSHERYYVPLLYDVYLRARGSTGKQGNRTRYIVCADASWFGRSERSRCVVSL